METFQNVPRQPVPKSAEQQAGAADKNFATDKVRQAYALLIWQESMPTRVIDTEQFERDLREAVGASVFDRLRLEEAADQEALRFLAADMFKSVTSLEKEAAMMSTSLLKVRLQAEVAALTEAMRDAEMRKDDAAVDKLFNSLNKLRERLAQISPQV